MPKRVECPQMGGESDDWSNTPSSSERIYTFWDDDRIGDLAERVDRLELAQVFGQTEGVDAVKRQLDSFMEAQTARDTAILRRIRGKYPRYTSRAVALIEIMKSANGPVPLSAFAEMVTSRSALSQMVATAIEIEPRLRIERGKEDRRIKLLRFVR